MPVLASSYQRVKCSLIIIRVAMILDMIVDFVVNKDERYQQMLDEFNELDSPLMQNLYLGNSILSITLLAVFSLQVIRVVVAESFGPLLLVSVVSIQVDIVWQFVDLGVDLWEQSRIGLILSFLFNVTALLFAVMIFTKRTKVKEFNFHKISV